MKVICIVPIALAVFAFLINGSDYFIGGMVGLLTGPLLYIIWRRRYGGLSKKAPDLFPVNPRTGLQYGDTKRITFLLLLMTIMCVAMRLFAPWYEGWFGGANEWDPDDYFDGMFPNADLTGLQHILQSGVTILIAVCGIACVVFFLRSKKLEAEK